MVLTTARAVSTAWWRSIGAPKHVCAPMVDQSSWRSASSRRYGAGLRTPMLHAGLAAGDPGSIPRQFTTRRGDWPCLQFAGHDPSVVCKAASDTRARGRCVDNIVALDLNRLPAADRARGRYGAWLWERDADAAVGVIRRADALCD